MADNKPFPAMSPIPPANQQAIDLQTISNLAQTPIGVATLNLAQDRGNDLATQNGILQDRATLNPYEFSAKYGQQAARMLDATDTARINNAGFGKGDRSTGEIVNDTVVNIGSGVASGFGGLGALALSPFSADSAVALSKNINDFNDMGRKTQSEPMQQNRLLDGIRRELDTQDEARQYKEDLATNGSVRAGLASVGRGAANALARMTESPLSIEAGVTEGIGSLFTGAPVAKGLSLLGKAALGVSGKAATPALSKIGEKIAMPSAIGLQEAGGTYMATASEIADMSHEDLMKGSAQYRQMVQSGMDRDKAKNLVANRAGQVGAAIQFPVAAATGAIVSKFEANPLQATTVRGALANIGKETAEELIQSGTGQFSQNVGTTLADNDKSLIEGVGSGAVEGAVYGFGTAAALSGPGVARNMAGATIKAAVGGLEARGAAARSAIEANSPASDTRVVRDLLDTQADVQTLADNIEASIPQASPEDQALAKKATLDLRKGMLLDRADFDAMSPASAQVVMKRVAENGEPNRAEAMIILGELAGNEQSPPAERIAAARDLGNMLARNITMLENLDNYLGKYSSNVEGFDGMQRYSDLLTRMQQAPSIIKAIEWLNDPASVPTDMTATDVVTRASLAPSTVPVAQARTVLGQIESGEVEASRAERIALAASIALNEATATVPDMLDIKPEELVSKQIATQAGPKAHMLSIDNHRARIVQAYRENDMDAANAYIDHAVNFAQTLANKVEAANQSIAQGFNVAVPYRTSGEDGAWLPERQWGKWTAQRNGRGIATMQRIAADANAMATFVNNLSDTLPEIARPRIQVPSLVLPTATEQVTEQVKETPAPAKAEKPKKAEQLNLDLQQPTAVEPQETTPEVKTPSEEQIVEDERMLNAAKVEARVVADEVELNKAKVEARILSDEREVMEDKKARREAQPQPQAEAEQEPTVEPAPTVEYDRHENLLRTPGEDKPYITKVLNVDNESGNRMLGEQNPVAVLKAAIKSPDALDAYVNDANAPKLTVDNRRALNTVLNLVPGIRETLEKNLNTRLLGEKMWQRFLDGTFDLTKTKQFQLANIAAWDGNKLVLNPALADLAVLAGLDTVLNYSRGKQEAKPATIRAALGVDMDADISSVEELWNSTSSVADIKRAIATRIEQYWGMRGNNSMPEGQVKGLSEGVAADIMEILSDEGFFKENMIEGFPKLNNRLSFNGRDEAITTIIDRLGAAKQLLGQMVTGKRDGDTFSIGSPVTDIPATLHNKPNITMTADNVTAIRNANATEYSTDFELFDFYAEASPEVRAAFQGGNLTSTDKLNENHVKTIEGKNRTIEMGFQATKDYVDTMRGNPEAKAYWPHTMISTNRMMQLGGITPQSDKLLRHVSVPTVGTVDMTDPQTEATFWLAVSQGMGKSPEKVDHGLLNYTTDREGTDPLINDMRDAFLQPDGMYAPLVAQVKDYLTNGKGNVDQFLTDYIAISGKDRSMHGLSSIFGVARYMLAMERNEDLTKFETNVYLEADGKTNGPAMSMAMLGNRSIYSEAGLKAMAKTGIFIGDETKTLNEHIAKVDGADLYQDSADRAAQNFADLRARLKTEGRNEALSQIDALARVMSAMSIDIKFDETSGELTIKRGATKNPLTITVYGSGNRGIAGNVASAITTAMYEYLSDVNASGGTVLDLDAAVRAAGKNYESASFLTDLSALSKTAFKLNDDGSYSTTSVKDQKLFNNPKTFSLPKEYFDALTTNIETFYVAPLMSGVDAAMKQYVNDNVQNIQKATNVQSIFAQSLYRARVAAAVLNKLKTDPNYNRNDFLSRNEQREIQKGMEFITASIRTGKQNFDFMGSQVNNLEPVTVQLPGREKPSQVGMPTEFARSTGRRFTTPAYSYGYDLAGVSGIPGMVIGTGDGMIIQNTWVNNPEAVAHTLPVYDGVNIRVGDIVTASRALNESVWTAMLSNPLADVSKAFDIFMKNSPQDIMAELEQFPEVMEEFRLNMSKAIEGTSKPKSLATDAEMTVYLESIQTDLSNGALEIEARNNVIGKRVAVSVDQMASAGAAFSKDGDLKRSDYSSDASFALAVERAILEETQRLKAKRDGDDGIDRNTDDLTAALDEYAVTTESGAKVLDASALRNYVRESGRDMPAGERAVFEQAVDVMQNLGWSVVYGDNQAEYEAQNFPADYSANEQGNYLGKAVVGQNRIYLTNVSAETLLHEMIHASTFDQVNQYYTDKANMPEQAANAVQRIEALMQEWMGLDTTYLNQSLLSARSMASNQITTLLQAGKRAEAVNEFMAWALANRELADDLATRKVTNPLAKIARDVYQAIKAMFWGDKRAPRLSDDFLSNLQFNAQVLIKSEKRFIMDQKFTAYQSASYGSNQRLADLETKIEAVIESVLSQEETLAPGNTTLPQREQDQKMALARGIDASQLMHRTAFAMTAQQGIVFAKLVSLFGTSNELDGNALAGMARLHREFIKDIRVEDFIPAGQEGNPNIQLEAQNKYDLLTGVYDFGIDTQSRTLLLPTFAALANVDDGFRALLDKKLAKQSELNDAGGIDAYVDNLGTKAMDGLSRRMSGQGNAKNVTVAIDRMTKQLLDINDDKRSFIEQQTNSALDRLDQLGATGIDATGGWLVDKSRKVLDNASFPPARAAAKLTLLVGTLLNKESATKAQQGITAALNSRDGGHTIREFVSEVVGRTAQNAAVFDRISPTRAAVHQARQRLNEGLPKLMREAFKKAPTREQWQDMFHVFGKTDLVGLIQPLGMTRTRELVGNPAAVEKAISDLITKINNPAIIAKADQLAGYMAGRGDGKGLLRNAYAIAHIAGGKAVGTAAPDMIANIDQYVSLKSLDNMSLEMKQRVADIIKEDNAGVDYVLRYMDGLRKDELARVNDTITRMNHYKGYIPSLAQKGSSLRLVSTKDHAKMVERGYTYLGDYVGNAAERNVSHMGYYFAPVSGLATYNQGAMLTTHQSASGVQPGTGFSTGQTAGRITDPVKVRQITQRLAQSKDTTENLQPVYGDKGQVVAYERSLDPTKAAMLNHNTDLSMMIGAWAGRIVEEQLAAELNSQLIDTLHEEYASAKDKSAFIDLASTTDKVWADTWGMFPQALKEEIFAKFGERAFYIRRDQVIDAVGTRSASVGDIWNGVSRMSDAKRDQLQKVALGIFGGEGAYRKLVGAERMIQDFVTDAKVLIVVKSIIVPVANMVANLHQLLSRGVPLRDVLRGSMKKTAEINEYVTLQNKLIKLEADLRAATGDLRKTRKLTTELETIQDTFKRMSIAPLIEAGEFSAVTEGGISQEDLALSEGRWGNYVEKLGNTLPEPLRTGYRYGTLSRDTSLFKGLGRAVQYGDFIAKAVYYDDLTKRQGLSKADALAKVSEEYVNYNRFAGRTRAYAESMGMIWFWNFKLRSMKVAANMLRDNPARALIGLVGTPTLPGIGSVGTPVTDNFLMVGIDGRLDNSIGPWMGFRAPSLNPWWQIMN